MNIAECYITTTHIGFWFCSSLLLNAWMVQKRVKRSFQNSVGHIKIKSGCIYSAHGLISRQAGRIYTALGGISCQVGHIFPGIGLIYINHANHFPLKFRWAHKNQKWVHISCSRAHISSGRSHLYSIRRHISPGWAHISWNWVHIFKSCYSFSSKISMAHISWGWARHSVEGRNDETSPNEIDQ